MTCYGLPPYLNKDQARLVSATVENTKIKLDFVVIKFIWRRKRRSDPDPDPVHLPSDPAAPSCGHGGELQNVTTGGKRSLFLGGFEMTRP